ncbi:hypothetical protein FOL47_008588 [Perkinsus chesapeaki]|uniref:Uncharacterized protein n=1 Tax=Perkinsus chesapeaki TaxID=330153 RepID=A0A7J6LD46_PERCH|nr:hypothetical protein FOL47_008588 [Perkinsus chesapeaki]
MPVSSAKSSQALEPSGVDIGVVNGEIGRGISLWAFFFVCCNIVISQVLSVPFMFTTAGWVAFITQALAAVLAFICIQLVRIALRDERVVDYAEQKGIPPFEREYTFLGEFCAGSLGRVGITLGVCHPFYPNILEGKGLPERELSIRRAKLFQRGSIVEVHLTRVTYLLLLHPNVHGAGRYD